MEGSGGRQAKTPYWNIKGCSHFVGSFELNQFCFSRLARYHFDRFVVPPRYHSSKELFCGQKSIPRSFRCPSAELRDQVRAAVKERGFRSEQAFLIAACKHEIRQGANTEATEHLESRVAAILANLARQIQGLQTLAHAQVALTDVLLKYVITCVVEPPKDALPAARVRARLRYEKLIRVAAAEISNNNRDTLKGMIAGE